MDERVNVLEDYRKYFKESETPKPAGIAVLTDADDTKSRAAGRLRELPRLRALTGVPLRVYQEPVGRTQARAMEKGPAASAAPRWPFRVEA